MPSSSVLIVLVCGIMLQPINGWGRVGHGLIARLTFHQLSKDASDWVTSLVPIFQTGNFTSVGSWADDILYPDTNPIDYTDWQWSRPLHYLNTPDWVCQYDSQRDCANDICIEGALNNYSRRVIDSHLDSKQHKEALLFLIHFVSNVHQPLHVGFAGDLGGNKVKGRFMNSPYTTNLHSLWDTGLITSRLSRDFHSDVNLYYAHLQALMVSQTAAKNDNDFKKWINESLTHVCEQLYLDETYKKMDASKNFKLGDIYFNRNIGLVEQRLTQAGRRLVDLVNHLAASRQQRL